MDTADLDKRMCIPQINKNLIFQDDLAIAQNMLDFGDKAFKANIINQHFNVMNSSGSLLIEKQSSIETMPLYPNMPNICLNSFIMDYNDDVSEFAPTLYVENIFPTTTATVIEDEQDDQIKLIQTVLDNIVDNVLIKCEENEQHSHKMNPNFLQVESVYPLSKWKMRRTSSLKQLNSADDVSNTTKKIVRFADSLGLDLIDVRTYMDEMPKIPLSAFQDLTRASCSKKIYRIELDWIPLFEQPDRLANFRERLSRNYVRLQSSKVDKNYLRGQVMVENMDYQKLVQIRFTRNNWKTYCDWDCSFMESNCDGFVDKFEFDIDIGDKMQVDSKIEFAVKFRCRDHEFWDNNSGKNYIFGLVPSVSRTTENDNEIMDPCSAECNLNNSEEPCDTNLTHTLVQDYMSKIFLQNDLGNQQTYQKQIRNSERTLEVFVITGVLIMCAIFLYIEKIIYFV